MIGWDPVAKKIRSWIFDSKAGFGEGEWSKAGNTWTVNVKSILGTGQKASSINVYTYLDPNSFGWQSIGREVQGELLPDIDQVTVVTQERRKNRIEIRKKEEGVMKRLALLALPISLVFCLSLAVDDSFSRGGGGGRGGGFGGGYGGGAGLPIVVALHPGALP